MKHYRRLLNEGKSDLFSILPSEYNNKTHKETLAYALGAALYMPADKENWSNLILLSDVYASITTIILDLEDALEDNKIDCALENIKKELSIVQAEFEKNPNMDIPLVFIRVRDSHMMKDMDELLHFLKENSDNMILTGFVFPKFGDRDNRYCVERYMNELKRLNEKYISKDNPYHNYFYCMPVLESSNLVLHSTREKDFTQTVLPSLKGENNQYVLNVRLGGTDISGLFSLRRTVETTIYDLAVVRDALSFFLNHLLSAPENFVVSGVVWEYFYSQDSFLKEISMDKANGIYGKTVIHPSHVPVVNAFQVVTNEEYRDAKMILSNSSGVMKSSAGNKMNEVKPHSLWALSILRRSKVFGVLNPFSTVTELI